MSMLAKDATRFAETRIGEETIVMSLETGDFFSLTGTGQAIWRLLDGTRDRTAVLAALAAEYDAPEAGLAADLDAFIAQLRQAGLLAVG